MVNGFHYYIKKTHLKRWSSIAAGFIQCTHRYRTRTTFRYMYLPVVHKNIRLPDRTWRHPDIRHLAVLTLIPPQVNICPLLNIVPTSFSNIILI